MSSYVLSKKELGEGVYFFIKDKKFFKSYRSEDLHGSKWSNIELIDSSNKLVGKVIVSVPKKVSFCRYYVCNTDQQHYNMITLKLVAVPANKHVHS